MTAHISRVSAAAALVAAFSLVVALFAAAAPVRAFADEAPTYTMTMTSDAGDTIKPGDTFSVTVNITRDGAQTFPMYALSTTIRYDADMLEMVGYTCGTNIDAYTTEQTGDWAGYNDIVLNYLSRSIKGTDWQSPTSILTMDFKAKEEGTTTIMVHRVNVSNTTGMGSYACQCTDNDVTISTQPASGGSAVTPSSRTSEGTTAGVEAEEVDLSSLPDEIDWSNLTAEEEAELKALGYDVEALKAQYAAENPGTNQTSGKGSATVEKTLPTWLIPVIAVIVIAMVVAIVIVRRSSSKKKAARTQAEAPRGKHAR